MCGPRTEVVGGLVGVDASSVRAGAAGRRVVTARSAAPAARGAREQVAGRHELVNDGVDGWAEVGRRVTVLLDPSRLGDQRLLLAAVDDRLLVNVLAQHQPSRPPSTQSECQTTHSLQAAQLPHRHRAAPAVAVS